LKGQQMKLRIPKRQPGTPGFEAALVHFCKMLDHCIPGLRTLFLVAGVLAAALKLGTTADFLFATGLLLQVTMWFGDWWMAQHPR
jgi:hypothetical protein